MSFYIRIFVILVASKLCVCLKKNIYDFTVQDYEGNDVSLDRYAGKVTLIVNVASECGYTEQAYKTLTTLHDILSYGDHFSVLAFPCNQFGEQEPNSAAEVAHSMRENYGIEFPIFDKINVVGANASPLYKALIDQSSLVPDWNFYKYLVGPDGRVVNAWGSTKEVEEIFDEIKAQVDALKAAALRAEMKKHEIEEKVSENIKEEL